MITTKKGDEGQSHFLGKVMDKNSPLLEAVGNIDELQSILELIRVDEKIIDDLGKIMGELACDIKFKELDLRIKWMDEKIDSVKQNLDKFVKFKGRKALKLNWARTVCRRVERRIVSLSKKQKVDGNILIYFNRFSDYLFLKAIIEEK